VHDGSFELPYETFIIATQKDEMIKEALQQAIASLPRRQRQLLQLRYYEQMGYEEIADKTSLSVRTVYNKLHEALKKLRSGSALKKMYNAVKLMSLLPFVI
jgi:RNA polymerase sigma-70 factor (ECF subfamily)